MLHQSELSTSTVRKTLKMAKGKFYFKQYHNSFFLKLQTSAQCAWFSFTDSTEYNLGKYFLDKLLLRAVLLISRTKSDEMSCKSQTSFLSDHISVVITYFRCKKRIFFFILDSPLTVIFSLNSLRTQSKRNFHLPVL